MRRLCFYASKIALDLSAVTSACCLTFSLWLSAILTSCSHVLPQRQVSPPFYEKGGKELERGSDWDLWDSWVKKLKGLITMVASSWLHHPCVDKGNSHWTSHSVPDAWSWCPQAVGRPVKKLTGNHIFFLHQGKKQVRDDFFQGENGWRILLFSSLVKQSWASRSAKGENVFKKQCEINCYVIEFSNTDV